MTRVRGVALLAAVTTLVFAAGKIDAAMLPEPFASDAEQADGAVPLTG
jgi:ABC-type nitrate/sulfonate/bicarbonate transport system substrate-binding protein